MHTSHHIIRCSDCDIVISQCKCMASDKTVLYELCNICKNKTTEEKVMESNKHFDLLGLKVKDAVTGFTGIVTTLSFDLYGCVQVVITPPIDKKGERKDGDWFDVTRLIIVDKTPVMRLPDFKKGYVASGRKGAAQKRLP